jgi:hypothetical protein
MLLLDISNCVLSRMNYFLEQNEVKTFIWTSSKNGCLFYMQQYFLWCMVVMGSFKLLFDREIA